jgi:hypothetical protein
MPAWIEGIADTGCIAANGSSIAVADRAGNLYGSDDFGRAWSCRSTRLPTPSGVLIRSPRFDGTKPANGAERKPWRAGLTFLAREPSWNGATSPFRWPTSLSRRIKEQSFFALRFGMARSSVNVRENFARRTVREGLSPVGPALNTGPHSLNGAFTKLADAVRAQACVRQGRRVALADVGEEFERDMERLMGAERSITRPVHVLHEMRRSTALACRFDCWVKLLGKVDVYFSGDLIAFSDP